MGTWRGGVIAPKYPVVSGAGGPPGSSSPEGGRDRRARLVSKSGGFTGKGIFFYAKRERDEYRVVFKIPASLRSLSGHVATDRYLGKVLPPRWTALVAAARGVSGGGNR